MSAPLSIDFVCPVCCAPRGVRCGDWNAGLTTENRICGLTRNHDARDRLALASPDPCPCGNGYATGDSRLCLGCRRAGRDEGARAPIAPAFPPDSVVLGADTVRALGVTCRRAVEGRSTWIGLIGRLHVVVTAIDLRTGIAWQVTAGIEQDRGGSRILARGSSRVSFVEAERAAESDFAATVAACADLERLRVRRAIGDLPGAAL